MVDDVKAIDNAVIALKNNGLVLKIVEGLQDYLFCKIKFSDDKKSGQLRQIHLIKNVSMSRMFRVTKVRVSLKF